MSEPLKIWDLGRFVIVLAGIPVTGGFGPDDVLKVEKTMPGFTTKQGADGSVARSKTYNGHAKFTLTLLQTSAANALLSAQYALDLASDNGAGVGVLSLKDLSGATLYFARSSWIADSPNPTFGREANTREWVIECSDLTQFEGGN